MLPLVIIPTKLLVAHLFPVLLWPYGIYFPQLRQITKVCAMLSDFTSFLASQLRQIAGVDVRGARRADRVVRFLGEHMMQRRYLPMYVTDGGGHLVGIRSLFLFAYWGRRQWNCLNLVSICQVNYRCLLFVYMWRKVGNYHRLFLFIRSLLPVSFSFTS